MTTQPLIDYYTEAGILKEVDGTIDINDVFAEIVKILENNHDLQTRNDRKIKAGHDKDHVYVIIRVEKNYLYLSDGDLKPLNQMKKKNVIHLQPILSEYAEDISADEAIRSLCRRIKNAKN